MLTFLLAPFRQTDTAFSDRFIPSRLSTNLEDALEIMENKDSSTKEKVSLLPMIVKHSSHYTSH